MRAHMLQSSMKNVWMNTLDRFMDHQSIPRLVLFLYIDIYIRSKVDLRDCLCVYDSILKYETFNLP